MNRIDRMTGYATMEAKIKEKSGYLINFDNGWVASRDILLFIVVIVVFFCLSALKVLPFIAFSAEALAWFIKKISTRNGEGKLQPSIKVCRVSLAAKNILKIWITTCAMAAVLLISAQINIKISQGVSEDLSTAFVAIWVVSTIKAYGSIFQSGISLLFSNLMGLVAFSRYCLYKSVSSLRVYFGITPKNFETTLQPFSSEQLGAVFSGIKSLSITVGRLAHDPVCLVSKLCDLQSPEANKLLERFELVSLMNQSIKGSETALQLMNDHWWTQSIRHLKLYLFEETSDSEFRSQIQMDIHGKYGLGLITQFTPPSMMQDVIRRYNNMYVQVPDILRHFNEISKFLETSRSTFTGRVDLVQEIVPSLASGNIKSLRLVIDEEVIKEDILFPESIQEIYAIHYGKRRESFNISKVNALNIIGSLIRDKISTLTVLAIDILYNPFASMATILDNNPSMEQLYMGAYNRLLNNYTVANYDPRRYGYRKARYNFDYNKLDLTTDQLTDYHQAMAKFRVAIIKHQSIRVLYNQFLYEHQELLDYFDDILVQNQSMEICQLSVYMSSDYISRPLNGTAITQRFIIRHNYLLSGIFEETFFKRSTLQLPIVLFPNYGHTSSTDEFSRGWDQRVDEHMVDDPPLDQWQKFNIPNNPRQHQKRFMLVQ
eukprot:gene6755-7852_t